MTILKLRMEVFLLTFVVTVPQSSAAVTVSVDVREELEEIVMGTVFVCLLEKYFKTEIQFLIFHCKMKKG